MITEAEAINYEIRKTSLFSSFFYRYFTKIYFYDVQKTI